MTKRLVCYHGHQLDLTEAASTSEERLVCPLCGSVTQFKASGDTQGRGPIDATLDLPGPGAASATDPHAPTERIDETLEIDMQEHLGADDDAPRGNSTDTIPDGSLSTLEYDAAAEGDDDSALPPIQPTETQVFDQTVQMDRDHDDLPPGKGPLPTDATLGTMEMELDPTLSDAGTAAETPPAAPSDERMATIDYDPDAESPADSNRSAGDESLATIDFEQPPADRDAGVPADPTLGTMDFAAPPDDRSEAAAPTDESLATIDFQQPPDGGDDEASPTDGSLATMDPVEAAAAARRAKPAKDRPSPPPEEPLEPPQLAGYRIIDELGRGGMGVVYKAYDEKHNRHVALKTLQRISPENLRRFKQEFRSLADIAHPNLAALYELVSDGRTWCFTMEMLEGVEFLEYVWSGFDSLHSDNGRALEPEPLSDEGRLSARRIKRLHEALKQLSVGLNALHEKGILHRDIKPSNVMVTTERRVVLLDFGLAGEMESDRRGRRIIQGTPEYMAPEQAAAAKTSNASDWYAVGVMLYEVLTGQLPIRDQPIRLLFRKQRETPPEPRRLEPTIPPELNQLCADLLSRTPSKRPTAADVLRCINAVDVAESLRGTHLPTHRQAFDLVGRERHLEILHESFEKMSVGKTISIFVHGKSGMGKSVLIQKFLSEIQRHHQAVVLEGRCYEQESVPFKALDSLIDSLSVHLGDLPDTVQQELMPDDSVTLGRLFPVMGQIKGAEDEDGKALENVDQQELRQRAVTALRELLKRLGARAPLVLYVDDLQWGDEDSAELLADLLRPPLAPRLLLLGSYRSENVAGSLCLKALDQAYKKGQRHPLREELAVDSLSDEDATRLALMLLGRDDDTSRGYARKIARESGGWPFFVWELAQHVQEDPSIADQTLELDEVIYKRVSRLPGETRVLLELIAVAGRPLPAAETYLALDIVGEGPKLLARLRADSFVRTAESEDAGTMVEAYHDRIRESVVAHLQQEQLREHNLRLAETTAQAGQMRVEELVAHIHGTPDYEEPEEPFKLGLHQWQRVFDLAYYYDAAGEHRRALPFALVAAERARSQNALDVAEQQYRIALRGAEGFDDVIRFRVCEGLGDVLNLRGKYDQARGQYQSALFLAEGDAATGRVEGKLGELGFKQGDMKVAMDHLERALAVLHRQVAPKSNLMIMPWVMWELFVQMLHSMFPRLFVGRRPLERAKEDMVPVRFYNRLFYVYWFARGMYPTFWTQLRGMNLAERYPPTPEMAQAYALHAVGMAAVPYYSRAVAYAKRAEEISREGSNLWAQGMTTHFHGIAIFAASKWENCIEKCEEAIGLLEKAGDMWEANMARYHIADSLYHLGRLKEAVHQARQVYATGEEIGDAQAMGVILIVWAASAPHQVPLDEIATEIERPREDPLSTVQVLQAQAFKLLFHDDCPAEAAEWFQKALDLAQQRGIKNTYIMWAHSWRATCLRLEMERAEAGSAHRRSLLRQARAAARRALRNARAFQNDLPHALRENAILAAYARKENKARRLFDESLQVARSQKAEYQYAKTLLARGQAGQEFGWPEAAEQLADGRALVESLEKLDD